MQEDSRNGAWDFIVPWFKHMQGLFELLIGTSFQKTQCLSPNFHWVVDSEFLCPFTQKKQTEEKLAQIVEGLPQELECTGKLCMHVIHREQLSNKPCLCAVLGEHCWGKVT